MFCSWPSKGSALPSAVRQIGQGPDCESTHMYTPKLFTAYCVRVRQEVL